MSKKIKTSTDSKEEEEQKEEKKKEEWLGHWPWVLKASSLSYLSFLDLTSLFWATKSTQAQVIKFVSEASHLNFNQEVNRFGLHLVRKHCRSLKELRLLINVKRFDLFSEEGLIWLKDVIRLNSSTLRAVITDAIWWPGVFQEVCSCSQLEELYLRVNEDELERLADVIVEDSYDDIQKQITLETFPRLKKLSLPYGRDSYGPAVSLLSQEFELQHLSLEFAYLSEIQLLTRPHFQDLEVLILSVSASNDEGGSSSGMDLFERGQSLDAAFRTLTCLRNLEIRLPDNKNGLENVTWNCAALTSLDIDACEGQIFTLPTIVAPVLTRLVITDFSFSLWDRVLALMMQASQLQSIKIRFSSQTVVDGKELKSIAEPLHSGHWPHLTSISLMGNCMDTISELFLKPVASLKRLTCWVLPHLLYYVLKSNPRLEFLACGCNTVDSHLLNIHHWGECPAPIVHHHLKELTVPYSPPSYVQFESLTTLDIGSGKEYTSTALAALFKQCPLLTSLGLNHVVISAHLPPNHQITKLSLLKCNFSSLSSLRNFLAAFPALTHLSLKSLEFNNGDDLLLENFVEWAETGTWPLLTSFQALFLFHITNVEHIKRLVTALPRLTHLKADFDITNPQSQSLDAWLALNRPCLNFDDICSISYSN